MPHSRNRGFTLALKVLMMQCDFGKTCIYRQVDKALKKRGSFSLLVS